MDGWVPANCDISGKEMKLYASKRDEKPVVIEKMANFHKFVIESKEVTKMYGMISSCMQVRLRGEFVCPTNRLELSPNPIVLQGIKLEFNAFNRIWERYKHVWEVDREDTIVTFVKRKPVLKDFEDELQKYNMARSQLTTEKVEYVYGSILISCSTLRETIDTEIKQDRSNGDLCDIVC